MTRSYSIVYAGKLASKHITRSGAQAAAFRLAQAKGWDINKIEIKEGE